MTQHVTQPINCLFYLGKEVKIYFKHDFPYVKFLFDSRVFRRKMRESCYGEPNMHCPPRAVQGCCCCYPTSFPPYAEVTVERGCPVGHQYKMAGVCWSVCFSFNRTYAFLQLWWRYLMNEVICSIDRRSTHRYHLFVWIIMKICNLTELLTGNPSLSLNPIAYGIFSFFQTTGGGGFLARTPENTG